MNKQEFINTLQGSLKLPEKDCIIINNVLEENFIFGKRNKSKIIASLKIKLNINEMKAEEIYNISMEIIFSQVKDKMKHPFRSKEN